LLRLTTDGHKASRGLFATAEPLVGDVRHDYYYHHHEQQQQQQLFHDVNTAK